MAVLHRIPPSAPSTALATPALRLDPEVRQHSASNSMLGHYFSGRELPLQQMVLAFPEVVDAEPVGELDLLERVGEQAVLVVGRPGSGSWCS